MVTSVTLRSAAKINIGLHITGKRPDGYHSLETLYYPVHELSDVMHFERDLGEECEIIMEGFKGKLALEDNLCYKAWKLMRDELEKKNTGIKLHLKKEIPAGAGLGGGSSNAATVMRGLRELWGVDVSDEKLAQWGERLGADVPFFIYNKPMYGTGTGTTLEEFKIDLSPYDLRLAMMREHSSTIEAYKALKADEISHPTPLKDLLQAPITEWRNIIFNDLEKPVFEKMPVVSRAKDALYRGGAIFASMSGSGSACFGIYEK